MLIAQRQSVLSTIPQAAPQTFPALARAVRSFGSDREAARAFLLGLEIPDTWVSEASPPVTYDDPMVVVDVDWVVAEDSSTHLAAICQRKYATFRTMQFDQRNQEVATEATAQSGVYYYGWTVNAWDETRSYAAQEAVTKDGVLYTAKAAIAANTAWNASSWNTIGNSSISQWAPSTAYVSGDIVIVDDGYGQALWKCSSAHTSGSSFDKSKFGQLLIDMNVAATSPVKTMELLSTLSAGDPVPYSSYYLVFRNSLSDTTRNIIRYGQNRYRDSAIRQYYNSSAGVGQWYTKVRIGQLAPSNLASYRGYLAGCSSELLSCAKKVRVQCWANTVTDGGATDQMHDLMWLPSGNQMMGNANANEGMAFEYWYRKIVKAMEDGGCTVLKYPTRNSFPSTGAAATVYIAEDTRMIYFWSGTTYTICNNDDRSSVSSGAAYAATKGLIDTTRIFRSVNGKTTAVVVRLRSANRGNSYIAWLDYTTGYLGSGGTASNAYASAPACAIF